MDRMIKLFVLVMWCAAGIFPVLAGNPLLLPEYVREYRVEFSSQEEAAAATMTASIPAGRYRLQFFMLFPLYDTDALCVQSIHILHIITAFFKI